MVALVAPPPRADTGPLGPIQVIPPGLTGLLQIKQLGRLPGTLADVVAPVVDLTDWYRVARRVDDTSLPGGVFTSGALATGAQGGHAMLQGAVAAQVPGTQIWYVEHYTLTATTALAADVISFAPTLITNGNSGSFEQVGPPYVDTVTARQRQTVAAASRPFWAPPGSIFGILIIDISTAGVTWTGHVFATPMPI